jgi:hypothetical protein
MPTVYPILPGSPFDVTPSYSGIFIPAIWSGKLQEKFYAASTFADVANTDWEGDIKGMGDTVYINTIPTVTINNYQVGMTLTYQVPTSNKLTLQINQGKYFGVQVNDVLEYQAKPNMMDMFTSDAGEQLKVAIDRDNWAATFNQGAAANMGANAGAISQSYNLGTDVAPVALTGSNILSVITSLSSTLDEQNVPESDRWLVLTPYDRQVLMASPLAQAQFMGDPTSIIRNGKIGTIDRFTVYVSNLLPIGLAGQNWDGTANAAAVKRHCMVGGHKSALSFASQIAKVESLPNPSDFGQLVRGLNIYGRMVSKPESLALAIVS